MNYLNLIKLLKYEVPEVFNINEFAIRYEKTSPGVMLSRLQKNNFIKSAGKNSGIYYNLLKINSINSNHILLSLKKLYGSIPIIITGFYIINEYTTQITNLIEYIVPCNLRISKNIEETKKIKKAHKWFKFFLNYTRINQFGILELLPEAVIFDMVVNSKDYNHLLTPDELDFIDKTNNEDLLIIKNLQQIINNYQKFNKINEDKLKILQKICTI